MLRATREDPAVAQAVGINVHRQRLWAFTLSGALAGFAGGLYVHMLGSITTEQVYLELTFITLAMLVVGGLTSLWGAVVGALAVSGLDSLLGNAENGVDFGLRIDLPTGSRLVVVGALMALVLILRPSGLTGGREVTPAAEAVMRVCVVGCGAVGSLFAANLALLDDVEVWAYDLSEPHVAAINERGLRLVGAGEVHATGIRATTRRGRAAAVRLRPRRDEGYAHRGGDRRHRARLRIRLRRLGPERGRQRGDARRDTSPGNSGHDVPGRQDPRAGCRAVGREGRHHARARSSRAPRRNPRSSGSAAACSSAGMPTAAVADARGAQWRKVIFNASTNPVGALTGLTHGRVCELPPLRRFVSQLVDEGKAVAAAQGIELDADPEDLIDHAARPDVAYGHKASMLQDVEAGRQTEIEYLNGGIVRFGDEHGVPTPLNGAVVALIKGMEASWTQS